MPREDISDVELTDHEIMHLVGEVLAQDLRIPLRNIRVSVEEGDIILSGVVDCVGQRDAAEQDAKRVPGIMQVINRIGVRPERAVGDDEIAENVMSALRSDGRTSEGRFEAISRDGIVTLRGEAVTELHKRTALDIAGSVYGVERVESDIVVLPVSGPTDHILEEQVTQELSRTPALHERNIHPHVEDGVVYLRGEVDLEAFVEDAVRTAADVPGVREVKNELRVVGGR